MSDICLQVLFISHKEEWGSETIFWIWNIKGFVANEGLHIFIPFILSVPNDSENRSSIDFYVHKPSVLVPRTPSNQALQETTTTTRSKLGCSNSSRRSPLKSIRICVQEHVKETVSVEKEENFELHTEMPCLCVDTVLPRKEIPTNNPQNENIILSIPNLPQGNTFSSIFYCRVHKSYKMVN